MHKDGLLRVALVGNPNTGKSSIFNTLTGLNQKVGNYPGITVERKEGRCRLDDGTQVNITDLPGTYSINPSSQDENIVLQILLSQDKAPDVVLVVADVINLKRNLLLLSQVSDLGYPVILAINMADEMLRKGIEIDIVQLEKDFHCKVVPVSARKGTGIHTLREEFAKIVKNQKSTAPLWVSDSELYHSLGKEIPELSRYKAWLYLSQSENLTFNGQLRTRVEDLKSRFPDEVKKLQHQEAVQRYKKINHSLQSAYRQDKTKATDLRIKIDRWLTHRIWGYVIFAAILLLIFQSVFTWASYPMDLIDVSFGKLSQWLLNTLPEGVLTRLLAEGVVSGLGGIAVFIPQIAILFMFVAILEESGYMSRVVFLMDKIMRRFGLSGKSVVPLISGTACAIPAVMAARNIENWKERLITILVTPFTTCAARLPVYVIIIALVIPDGSYFGLFNLQGLTLMGLYLLGFASALIAAFALHKFLKLSTTSYFVVEMPEYKLPMVKNVAMTVVQKTKAFIFDAGKIILAISIVLWVMASYGPGDRFEQVEANVTAQVSAGTLAPAAAEDEIAAQKLENSYIGIMGKQIEPVIAPLGYDWKIGIALITSFAAREVFVATLATIYAVGNGGDDENTIKERMKAETVPGTAGMPRYTLPVGLSLLVFYAFAMQCMSTLAVVKRETNSWKWPAFQLISMTVIAYVGSFIVYNLAQALL